MKINVNILFVVMLAMLGFFLTGCSLSYNLNPTISSVDKYEVGQKKEMVLRIKDNRIDTEFMKGISNMNAIKLNINNVDDPIAWIAKSLESEFNSRGVDIKITTDEANKKSDDIVLTVNKFQILNSRASAYHPYVAYHLFAGKIHSINLDNMVVSYFLYGKVPVWSMNEVQKPCFDMPASILVKEIASKINRLALGYSMSDKQLEKLITLTDEKIKTASPDAYLSVIDIGGSNNKNGMDYLVKLADGNDILIRACALSAIGILGAEEKLDFLKEKYAQYSDIDRFMALKSIGDVGNQEAKEFLINARKDPQYNDEYGFKFGVDLYLEPTQWQ